nr:cyclase family protein [Bacillus sp. FJAT-44742]
MNLKYTTIIDLSMPVTTQTPIYPGDPKPEVTPSATIEGEGYNVSHLHMGSHTGTHIDAPYHFRKEGKKLDEIPLSTFAGEGVVLDVTGKGEGESITLNDILPYSARLAPNKIALIYTGWDKYREDEKYYRHPYISEEAVVFMLEKGIRVFFIDALNIDVPDGSSFKGHELITEVNGIIGENFANFHLIDFENPFVMALPLPFPGLDGSPVRAVALKAE